MTYNQTITLTFGEVAENCIGMEKVGEKFQQGITCEELLEIQNKLSPYTHTEIIKLENYVNAEVPPSWILLIKNGINILLANDGKTSYDLYFEQNNIQPDKTFYNPHKKYKHIVGYIPNDAIIVSRTIDISISSVGHYVVNGKNYIITLEGLCYYLPFNNVSNKIARYNYVISDLSQKADIQNRKGTVISYDDVPYCKILRRQLEVLIGKKGKNLHSEVNVYHTPNKTGIGFHGDTERSVVIGMRLGRHMELVFAWFQHSKPISERIVFNLDHGDIYIMSDYTVGGNWKDNSIPTLRHSAGSKQYTNYKPDK